jgi:hypothetical protein
VARGLEQAFEHGEEGALPVVARSAAGPEHVLSARCSRYLRDSRPVASAGLRRPEGQGRRRRARGPWRQRQRQRQRRKADRSRRHRCPPRPGDVVDHLDDHVERALRHGPGVERRRDTRALEQQRQADLAALDDDAVMGELDGEVERLRARDVALINDALRVEFAAFWIRRLDRGGWMVEPEVNVPASFRRWLERTSTKVQFA